MLPQSASSVFLLVQVLVVALLHRLLQEVHGFGSCGGCLGFEDGFGFWFCDGWVLGRLGFGDGLWVWPWVCSVGLAVGLWVWPWVCGLWPWVMGGLGLQWISGLMLDLDCGGFSGGSFDFVVFLVEGLILSAVVQFTVCWDVGFCFAA